VIAVVDTGGANLASVTNALDRLRRPYDLTTDLATIRAAEHVILPGVGAARDAMDRVRRAGLVEPLTRLEQPTLGICLGMQLLFDHSEEGDADCLGVIPGTVTRMVPRPGERIPHMGWSRVRAVAASPLLDGEAWYYFVHGYRAPSGEHVLALADHTGPVPAVVQRDNYYGCQFHPERSGAAGAQFLERFLAL
jgi:glutamine amidotransferase